MSTIGDLCSFADFCRFLSIFVYLCLFQVKFVGESVDDCGGGYSESVAEMCDELQSQNHSLELLITTPNGRDESGTSRDCFLFNPTLTGPQHLNSFR